MNITYQIESFGGLINEIKPLLQSHYEEIARHRGKIALNPDYDKYRELDRMGFLHGVTVRNEGKLIGYFLSFVIPHLHYKDHIFSSNDVVFVSKEYRKGTIAAKMFKFAEATLKEKGVTKMHVNVKLANDFGSLLERLGYVPIERIYEKILI